MLFVILFDQTQSVFISSWEEIDRQDGSIDLYDQRIGEQASQSGMKYDGHERGVELFTVGQTKGKIMEFQG